MDECLVPVDGEEYKIDDNEIRSNLVDALPVGANLMMLFDTFHTGENVIDVPEYRENRVYVPWISRTRRSARRRSGLDPRRKSFTGNAMSLSPIVLPKPFAEWHGSSPDRGAIVEHRRTSAVPQFPWALLKDTKTMLVGKEKQNQITRPVSLFELPESAEVMSLAACQDSQQSWEDGGTKSMTNQLVRILQHDPQPSLRAVLASVRNGLHRVLNSKSANLGMLDRPVPAFDMDNFQDPELASHKPLDMGRQFTL
ncbi:hypothetical protein FB45DRAFT_169940 [Roridomyces roridus]|uniref:Peptidase C14 caspase domain-containing protein n=1 Tax=Roridomyces roridus TaxID=1738132 RepID=A0AAD7BED2_9AGAR|nr:hypothetical protein FB45DRAFT_169940 [Roridomyces roridus]